MEVTTASLVHGRHARPWTFAHRGGAALWPENTVRACVEACRLGVDALELDLRLTKDGHVVVLHDDTVDRTTEGHGRISEMTLAEAQALDAGFRHMAAESSFPFRGQGLRIPTFEEIVEACPDVRLNVELKPQCPGLVDAFVELLARHDLRERLIVASGSSATIAQFRRMVGESYATAASRREAWLFFLSVKSGLERVLSPQYQALQVPDRYGVFQVVTKRLIDRAHDRSIDVHVWTVNDQDRIQSLLAEGADGIISDRPDRVLQALAAPPL